MYGFACGLRLRAVGLRLRPFLCQSGNSLCLLGVSALAGLVGVLCRRRLNGG